MTTDFAEQSIHELIYLLAVSFPKFFHICVLQPQTTLCLQNVALSLTSYKWFWTDTQLGVRFPRPRHLMPSFLQYEGVSFRSEASCGGAEQRWALMLTDWFLPSSALEKYSK